MEKPQRNFVKGAAILGGMGLISKIFGAVYTILTTNVIGTEAMASYMAAFPVYTFLLAMSSAGLPVAISKMVSERITLGDYKAAHMVFKKALRAMIIVGVLTTVIMIVLSSQIAAVLGRPEASLTIMALAPSLLFVSIISAYRGYFQGMQSMTPTAISQVIEQVVKLGAGLYLAYAWIGYGPEYGAAGAILGITVSEVIAFVYMYLLYMRGRKGIKNNIKISEKTRLRRGIGSKIFYLALPIIIGSCAMPIVQLADTTIINNTLMGMKSIILFGKEVLINSDVVKSLFGLTGYVNPIINMPAVLSLALGMSLVPSISASRARRDGLGVSNKSATAFKLSMLVGLPCSVGLFLLSTPIIHLLYSLQDVSKAPAIAQLYLLSTAGSLLAINAASMLSLSVLQTMTGILQGLGKTYLPVINLFIGIAVKVAVSIIFIRMPSINILGAFIGTVACYTVAAVLDVICVVWYTGAKLKILDNFIKPVLATGAMGAFVYLMIPYLTQHTPQGTILFSRPVTIFVIVAAMVVYILFMFIFGALNSEDMMYVPGGKRITRLMVKLRLWKASA